MARKKKKNILLFFMSTMNPRGEEQIDISSKKTKYLLENGAEVADCVQTNEPVIHDVVQLLKKQNEFLDAIYFFSTEQVQNQKVRIVDSDQVLYDSITEREYLEQRWRRLYTTELSRTEFHHIDYCYPTQSDIYEQKPDLDLVGESSLRVSEMAEKVKLFVSPKRMRKDWKETNLYADITGGFRHATMMMTALIQVLQYNGMKLQKLLYSDFLPGRALNKVFDFGEISHQYKLINGADEFIRFGSVHSLEEYFGTDYEKLNANPQPSELDDLLLTMHQFANAIHICATNEVRRCMREMRQAVKAFQQAEKKDVRAGAFGQLFDNIYEEYGALLKEDCDDLDVIEWCMDKEFYQQALTLYVEWLPILFVQEKIIRPADEAELKKAMNGKKGLTYRTSWQRYFITDYPREFGQDIYAQNLKVMVKCGKAIVAPQRLNDVVSILLGYVDMVATRNAISHALEKQDAYTIGEVKRKMEASLYEIRNYIECYL